MGQGQLFSTGHFHISSVGVVFGEKDDLDRKLVKDLLLIVQALY